MHEQCLGEKFFHMAHVIFENQSELGFSAENLSKVKDLKINTKKSLIKATAEIDTIAVDIMAKMRWKTSLMQMRYKEPCLLKEKNPSKKKLKNYRSVGEFPSV